MLRDIRQWPGPSGSPSVSLVDDGVSNRAQRQGNGTRAVNRLARTVATRTKISAFEVKVKTDAVARAIGVFGLRYSV